MTLKPTYNAFVLVIITMAFGAPLTLRAQSIPLNTGTVDMDCKTILCIPAGFAPPECQDAKAYMLKRLSQRPPKPPFDICEGAGTTPIQAILEKYTRLETRGPFGEGDNYYTFICETPVISVKLPAYTSDPVPYGPETCRQYGSDGGNR